MNDQQAAAFLQLTVRTLRNYRRAGKLPYREVKGKTRPVIEYDRADLERLKEDIQKRQRRSKKPVAPVPAARPRVTFALPDAEYEELSREAGKYGLGVGEYARRLAREGLESRFRQEADELRGEMGKAKAEIRKMRSEFSSAFEAVLEFVGLSEEEARKWVGNNLR